MTADRFSIRPLTPTIGAELSGLDLSRAMDQETSDAVYQALLDHLVIFLRDQAIGPADQLAFAEGFGEIDRPHPIYPPAEGHPNVVLLDNGPDRRPDTAEWHTDLTFYERPPFASILLAKQVPDCGGDTLWSNMYAAYDTLPPGMKADLEGLTAIHDLGDFRNDFVGDGQDREALNAAISRTGSALHPVVPRHPVTGRPYLFVNQPFTRHIVGLSTRESDRLLRYLYDHLDRPEFQVRFQWRAGSLAMWDNRVTQHYAVDDYYPHRRVMHRVTVVEDRRAAEGWRPKQRLAG